MIRTQPKLQVESDVSFFFRHWPLVSLSLLLMLANFWFGRVFEPILDVAHGTMLFYTFLIGVVLGEIFIVAALLGLIATDIFVRILLGSFCIAFLAFAMLIGLSSNHFFPIDVFDIVIRSPAWAVVSSLPFFVARWFFSRRLVIPGTKESGYQASILELMIITALVALSFALFGIHETRLVRYLVGAVFVSGVVFVFVAPWTEILFKRIGIGWFLCYIVLLNIIVWVVFRFFLKSPGSDVIMVFGSAALGVFGLFMHCLKLSGFRLLSGDEESFE